MTPEENLKTLGFKDMHPEQIQALLNLIQVAFLAADEEMLEDVHAAAEDLVVILGGVGIDVHYEIAH